MVMQGDKHMANETRQERMARINETLKAGSWDSLSAEDRRFAREELKLAQRKASTKPLANNYDVRKFRRL